MPSPYAEPWHVERIEDCLFYHVMDLPGHGVVGGQWDLRGHEDEYLGGIPLEGRRVLEIGPASGFLTFHMESRGADVVAVELGPDVDWDRVPHAAVDVAASRAELLGVLQRLRRGFWLAHGLTGSRARVHYGDVYDLPAELGRFDVAVMGSVLLHVRDPLRVVEQCARLADTVVIADMHDPELGELPVQRLYPSADSSQWDTWWRFSPALFTQFLGVMGFETAGVTYHEQKHVSGDDVYPMPLFTVVAHRRAAADAAR